jgi:methylated-DNA-[protein]-cysteine S-methyltransferase
MPGHYCLFDTAFGPCGIAWNPQGLTRLQLPEPDHGATERRLQRRVPHARAQVPALATAEAIAALQRYFSGEPEDFSNIAVDLEGISPFHQKIYAALRRVGWGQVTSYGTLARAVGEPDAARAIGQAMRQNPVPIVIPCHRVLAAGRKVGGFSAPGGATTKVRLLKLEGVRLDPAADEAPRLPGF